MFFTMHLPQRGTRNAPAPGFTLIITFLLWMWNWKYQIWNRALTKILWYHLNWAEIINLYNNNTFQNNKKKISLRWLGQPISTFYDLFSNRMSSCHQKWTLMIFQFQCFGHLLFFFKIAKSFLWKLTGQLVA